MLRLSSRPRAALLALALALFSCLSAPVEEPTATNDPVLVAIADTTITEGQTLAFTVSASSPIGDSLVYFLTGPVGSTLTERSFSWTPTHAQAGTYLVRFTVRAAGNPGRADTTYLSVNVLDAAAPPLLPVLALPGDTTLDEGEPLAFTVSAASPIGDSLLVALQGPSGAVLTGRQFSWTPDYNQAGAHWVLFIARAAQDAARADTALVRVTVRDVPASQIPAISTLPEATLSEGQVFSLTLAASDPRGTGLEWTMFNAPPGATLNGNTFAWTPTFSQAGDYLVRLIASDKGAVPRRDTLYLFLNVEGTDLPPVFAARPDTTAVEGSSLAFTISAVDPDGGAVQYSMIDPPAGALLTGAAFSWAIDTTQAGTHVLTFVAMQLSGQPALKDTLRLLVIVQDGAVIPPTWLVAHWDFNEGSGTTLNDKTSGGRNAAISGNPTWTTGVQGGALSFNGTNQYAQTTGGLPDMDEQTITAWVYLNTVRWTCFFSDANTAAGRDNRLGIGSSGTPWYEVRNEGSGILQGSTVVQTGKWYFYAGTASSLTSQQKVYLNGKLDGTVTGTPINLSGYHGRINIGRLSDGGSHVEHYTHGMIDEVKVYNKALTAEQILTEFNRYRANVGL